MHLFDPGDLTTLRPWLLDHVCPFWLQRVTDPAGGFFEELDALVRADRSDLDTRAAWIAARAGTGQAAPLYEER